MVSPSRLRITVGLLAATLVITVLNDHRPPHPLVKPLSSIDKSIAGWKGTDDPPLRDAIEASLSATSYLLRTYRQGPRTMNLFIAFYQQERAGESMHSPKYCLSGSGWELVDSGMVAVPFNGKTVRLNNYLMYREGARARALYWYQGQRRATAEEYMNKMYLVWDALRYGETSGSIVRLTLHEGPTALEDGVAFARELLPQVDGCFRSAGYEIPAQQ